MNKAFLIGATLASLSLTGCDSDIFNPEPTYKLETVQGDTYLLNQKTGDLSVISKDKLIKLESFKWPSKKLLTLNSDIESKIGIDIKAKLMGNKVMYTIKVTPHIDQTSEYEPVTDLNWYFDNLVKKNYEYNRITIDLKDADGFEIDSHSVYINKGFTQALDYEGNRSSAIYNGEFSVNSLRMVNLDSIGFTYSMSVLDKIPKIKKKELVKSESSAAKTLNN